MKLVKAATERCQNCGSTAHLLGDAVDGTGRVYRCEYCADIFLVKENLKTLCWQCSKEYNIEMHQCPHCKAANANYDLEQARKEAMMTGE